ncbi:DUF4190 domain-containing protein [Mycolicibacterium sp. 050158]|jgi:ABC-type Fe3+ transport system permease subunit|uniref:DUF4190 domain-containing protein n=1 Tax=Mycolicibacterium sp. 050158 TaxID=3090602 RepID=UPI00299CD61C|nr:DUF4190 domain-containing protein [Mycolicibacterium sp. 050158]MDX1891561.1 DUF4190 domain-containing protein [Mycolicibacterium sp. 050158]
MTGPRNGAGTAALVLAVAGLVFCWSVIGGVVCGGAAFVLGFVGRGRAARGQANNAAIATAGIALGFVAVVVSLAFAVIWTYAWQDAGGNDYLDCATRAGNDRAAVQACMDGWIDHLQQEFGVTVSRPTQGST